MIQSKTPLVLLFAMLFAMLAACSGPVAPPATLLLSDDLRPLLDADTMAALSEPNVRVDRVALPSGASVQVSTTSAATSEGGRFLLQVDIHVDDAASWNMGASRSGGPINIGNETGNAAQMSQSYLISCERDAAFQTELRQTMIQVTGAGVRIL